MDIDRQASGTHTGWIALQWHLWRRWSLRRKLSASLLALERAKALMSVQIQQDLIWGAQETSRMLLRWREDHRKSLLYAAWMPDIRSLDPRKANAVLGQIQKLFNDFSFSLISRNGTVIAKAGTLQPHPQMFKTSALAQSFDGASVTQALVPDRRSQDLPLQRRACVSRRQSQNGTADCHFK